MLSRSQAIQSVVDQLARHPVVLRVWLFGSRARADADDRSDIDLAVEAPRAGAREWLELSEAAEDADTLLPIDLVHLERAPQELVERIRADGKLLYER